MQKKKLVIDTNVFVSAAIGKGYSFKIIDSFSLYNSFYLFYSEQIIAEYDRVNAYDRILKKYPSFRVDMGNMITALVDKGKKVVVKVQIANLKDASDNKFLDLAYACKADYLITGNHLDFTITEFYQTKIVSPKQFWEAYEAGSL